MSYTNNKKGFSLVELMFVMVLLAVIAIIVYPYVLNSYKKAQKDTFLTESKNIYRLSVEKYGAELVKNNRLSTITTDNDSKLSISSENIKYCVNLDNNGNVLKIKVTNGTYYLEGDGNFQNDATLETIKYGEFNNFSCAYELDENDLREEVTLEEMKADEDYLKALKIIGAVFVVVVFLSLFVRRKPNR